MIRTDILLIAASSVLLASPAEAQRHKAAPVLVSSVPQCPPASDRYTDWMQTRPPVVQAEVSPIPKTAVHEVYEAQRSRAVAMLEGVESVELSLTQARELAGEVPEATAREGKPFLLRNVVPSFVSGMDGPVSLSRVGSVLRIRAGLFGCGGFFKNPLVVFLPFTPTRVDIQATAIW